jgi:dTDP-4-amino-4,6-dideoxygalactose transaminase
MRVPLVDVAWQHQQVRAAIDKALDELLTETMSDGSQFVHALEASIAERMGAGVQAIAVQSGTAAQFLTLKGLGIGHGDEVITVPNSDLPTTATISHTGARFVLVDINPATYNIDHTKIEAAITARTKAIVAVHMYGLPAEMEPILEIARKRDIPVIEDATLALGAEYRGQMAGTLGEAGFFSFAPRKVLGGTGNGGIIVTRNPELARQVRLLRGYGRDPNWGELPIIERLKQPDTEHLVEGHNLKIDSMQAAVIGAKLTKLEEWGERRNQVAWHYTELLTETPGIETPVVPRHMRHAWRNYVVKVPERDQVRAMLAEQGIATAVLYIPPVHLQPVYRHLGLGVGSFPQAEAAAKSLLALPMHPGLSDEQVEEIAGALSTAVSDATAAH